MDKRKMKVTWLFPPSDGGFPNISQYRFYKRMPIRISIIYPYLAASGVTLLKQHGFDVEFLDCPTMALTWQNIHKSLVESDLVVMEARTPIMPSLWKTCLQLRKEYPDAKIALYGDHVTYDPVESFPYCDHIVCGGDFDYGVLRLAQTLRDTTIRDKVFVSPLLDDLDELPIVDRELVSWKNYYETWRHRDKFFWTMSMRGCFYHCTFCAWTKTFWENRVRYRSPVKVALEYKSLHDKYGECEVLDDADLFVTSWGKKFAAELEHIGFNAGQVLWAFQTHPNEIHNLNDLKSMRNVGLRTVKLGVESGNQSTLNLCLKQSTIRQIEKAIALLKEADIMVHANIIVGWPWETQEQAYHTIQWIKKLNPNQAQFSLLIPYPNTELYEMAKSNNWLLVGSRDWGAFDASQPMLKMQGLTPEEVTQLYKDSWSQFYFDRKYIWNHIKKVRHIKGVKQLVRGYRAIKYGHMEAMK